MRFLSGWKTLCHSGLLERALLGKNCKKKKGALSRQPLEGTEIPSFYTSVGLVTLNPKGTF